MQVHGGCRRVLLFVLLYSSLVPFGVAMLVREARAASLNYISGMPPPVRRPVRASAAAAAAAGRVCVRVCAATSVAQKRWQKSTAQHSTVQHSTVPPLLLLLLLLLCRRRRVEITAKA